MVQILKQTVRETFRELGVEIELELTVPTHREAPKRLSMMARLAKASRKKDGDGDWDAGVYYQAMEAEDFRDFVEDSFARSVRPINLQDEHGKEITTGNQLLAIASYTLVQRVLNRLQALCLPSVEEGKGSPSPSGSASAPAAATSASSSDATSTEPEGGPTPSTATASPATA